MKKKMKDNSFDYMTVWVRADNLDEVKRYYQVFLWEIIKEYKHSTIGDLFGIELRRPHDIKDKDKFQYLQVQMEFSLNEQAKLDRSKHKKSISIGLSLGLLCALIIAVSIFMFVRSTNIAIILMGALLLVLGIILGVLATYISSSLHKQEIVQFNKKTEKIFDDIENICERVKSTKKEN